MLSMFLQTTYLIADTGADVDSGLDDLISVLAEVRTGSKCD